MSRPPPASNPPRVVLDTNVVLSAVLFTEGALVALRRAWQKHRCTPLVSNATIGELIRVLGYPKFSLSAGEQEDLLADYLPYCETVHIPSRAPVTPRCRDPFDVAFLELALVGKAKFLVTGDRDLLSLASKFRCPIVSAEGFLTHLGST